MQANVHLTMVKLKIKNKTFPRQYQSHFLAELYICAFLIHCPQTTRTWPPTKLAANHTTELKPLYRNKAINENLKL